MMSKSKGTIPLVLTKGDIIEIGEKVWEVIVETWNKVDDY